MTQDTNKQKALEIFASLQSRLYKILHTPEDLYNQNIDETGKLFTNVIRERVFEIYPLNSSLDHLSNAIEKTEEIIRELPQKGNGLADNLFKKYGSFDEGNYLTIPDSLIEAKKLIDRLLLEVNAIHQHLITLNHEILSKSDSSNFTMPKLRITFAIEELACLFSLLQESGDLVVQGGTNREKALLILNSFETNKSKVSTDAFTKHLSPSSTSYERLSKLLEKWQKEIETKLNK